MKYDIIFIIESNFQEKVVNYLVENYFSNKTLLIISKCQTGFKTSEGHKIDLDFNHISGIFKSFLKPKKFPKLHCEILINTVFTGINCRVFETLINYKKLYLIDDGIGTPVILKYPQYYKNFPRERVKMLLTNIILLLNKGRLLKNTRQLISLVDSYYTVYPLRKIFKNEIGIDLLKQKLNLIDKVGFIGQPLVEYKMISIENYTNALKQIIKEYGTIDYYPDPAETLIHEMKIKGLNIISKNEALESFLVKKGLPKVMFTYTSSALLNIRISNNLFSGYYIVIPGGGAIREYYYDIFKEFNLKEYQLNAV